MKKFDSREALIAAMSEDLAPVKRVKPAHGLALICFATAIAAAASIGMHNFWFGMLHGEASGYFWITHGLLLMVGVVSAIGVVAGAQPRVGSRGSAPQWSAAMLAILPVAALLSLLSASDGLLSVVFGDSAAMKCFGSALIAGSLVAAASVLWLRRGAPVAIERSAWLTGLAAGALGTLAYGITCPVDSLAHVGIWHVAPVAISAVIGRLIVPPMIRW